MVNYFKILCLLSIISTIFCRTPYEYSLAVSAGYDDNAMRFSANELKEAILNNALMGGSSTFDSYITKFSFSGKKSFIYYLRAPARPQKSHLFTTYASARAL